MSDNVCQVCGAPIAMAGNTWVHRTPSDHAATLAPPAPSLYLVIARAAVRAQQAEGAAFYRLLDDIWAACDALPKDDPARGDDAP